MAKHKVYINIHDIPDVEFDALPYPVNGEDSKWKYIITESVHITIFKQGNYNGME